MTETAAATPRSESEPIRIEYVPRSGLMGLSIVNFLLSIVTLTLYRFWAKTNIRRHVWSCVHINGQPLEYTGRGFELFKGALVVFAVLGLPLILAISAMVISFGPEHPAIAALQMLAFLLVALLWGAALYRARRYQLSRTLWRGIRGTMAGSAVTYSLLYFGSMIARAVTLGWSTPAMNLNLNEKMIGDMRFGETPFRFKGRAGPLYPAYALCWVLTVVAAIAVIVIGTAVVSAAIAASGLDFMEVLFRLETSKEGLGDAESVAFGTVFIAVFAVLALLWIVYSLIWPFYVARELRIFTSYTSFDNARFKFDVTAGSLILLVLGNILIFIFTLSIGRPYIVQRLVRYFCERMTVEGTVDVDQIRQSMAPISTMGEGLADAFDVGGI